MKFVEHRVADRRVVRLIQKWLNASALEDGTRTRSEDGKSGEIFAHGREDRVVKPNSSLRATAKNRRFLTFQLPLLENPSEEATAASVGL